MQVYIWCTLVLHLVGNLLLVYGAEEDSHQEERMRVDALLRNQTTAPEFRHTLYPWAIAYLPIMS